MKITIEPSPGDPEIGRYVTVTLDTRGNDESTPDAVTLALDGLRTYGHDAGNIAAAAEQWAQENQPEDEE